MRAARNRFSIAFLMLVVLLVAVDFGIVRSLWDWAGIVLAILPTINLLILGLLRLRRPDVSRRFWVSFEVVGWIMVMVASLTLWFSNSDVVFAPIIWLINREFYPNNSMTQISLMIASIIILYSFPQILIATFFGWFTSRYRIVIERRPLKAFDA